MPAIEEAVKKIDVPPEPAKNVELTVYMLIGSETGTGTPLPADLQSAAAQIKSLSAYKTLRLLDTVVARTRTQPESWRGRSIFVPGVVTLPDPAAKSLPTQLEVGAVNLVPDAKGQLVRINSLNFRMSIPTGTVNKDGNPNYNNTGIDTSVDVREGQKVVIGKSSMAGTDKALILVLTAKVLD